MSEYLVEQQNFLINGKPLQALDLNPRVSSSWLAALQIIDAKGYNALNLDNKLPVVRE